VVPAALACRETSQAGLGALEVGRPPERGVRSGRETVGAVIVRKSYDLVAVLAKVASIALPQSLLNWKPGLV
jgi:hypothetical protein